MFADGGNDEIGRRVGAREYFAQRLLRQRSTVSFVPRIGRPRGARARSFCKELVHQITGVSSTILISSRTTLLSRSMSSALNPGA